jgi:hypothetical protein
VNIDQLALDEPPPEIVCRRQAWKDDYPWLDRAFNEAGPGARAASDSWRVRIENELKTTLDFKLRPDGTAAVWCGMSRYDFHHYPTTKELFEGLAEAYRREVKRKARRRQQSVDDERRRTRLPIRALPPRVQDSLTRALGALLLLRAEQVMLIFLATTALTLVLSMVAIAVR